MSEIFKQDASQGTSVFPAEFDSSRVSTKPHSYAVNASHFTVNIHSDSLSFLRSLILTKRAPIAPYCRWTVLAG